MVLTTILLACHSFSALSPQFGRPLPQSAGARRALRPVCQEAAAAPVLDLVGDGGVLKSVARPGAGSKPPRGATVEVHYEGRLEATGAVFDSSRARNKVFKFTLGEGKVIAGWEVGLASMQPGEVCKLTCAPQYGYGAKGIPPMIPPSATLDFEVELVSVQLPQEQAQTFADDNPSAPRTPQAIQSVRAARAHATRHAPDARERLTRRPSARRSRHPQAYESKMAAKPKPQEGMQGALEWVKSIYIFGLFSSKGERPPWYLNPLITFPSIFAVVGLGFYLVVALGGVHRGEVCCAPRRAQGVCWAGQVGRPACCRELVPPGRVQSALPETRPCVLPTPLLACVFARSCRCRVTI